MNIKIEQVATAIAEDPRFADTFLYIQRSMPDRDFTAWELKEDPFLGELVRYFTEGLGLNELSACSDPILELRDEYLERMLSPDLPCEINDESCRATDARTMPRILVAEARRDRETTVGRITRQKKQYDGD